MKSRNVWVLVLSCAVALGACEKSRSVLGGDDVDQLKHLPGDNLALVGGNYMKLQNFMSSSMGKMMTKLAAKSGTSEDAMVKWLGCFTEMKSLRLVGGVATKPGGVELRMAFSGMSIADIAKCANTAGYKNTTDPDGKFLTVEMDTAMMTVKQSYLALKDGNLYSRQGMAISVMPTLDTVTRADLEGDAAKAAKQSASDDKALTALIGKADRSKTVWLVGSMAQTPFADKVGEFYGSFDMNSGLALDFTVQITDAAMADKLEGGVTDLKKAADQLPENMRGVIQGLELKRTGDHFRIGAKISDAQFQALMASGGLGM